MGYVALYEKSTGNTISACLCQKLKEYNISVFNDLWKKQERARQDGETDDDPKVSSDARNNV